MLPECRVSQAAGDVGTGPGRGASEDEGAVGEWPAVGRQAGRGLGGGSWVALLEDGFSPR